MTSSSNPLDKYADDDIFSTILRWSLYFGAFFQLACIMASIFMSTSDKDDVDTLEDSKANAGEAQPNNRRLHKLRKQEKKKRR
ncbi:protein anon-73B1 [Cochliomyia hominivorax]